ncbi:tetratricopeptide repeat protein [Antribacter sp. KLBMP9083]|uniref:Tetratricopeptide repeat protein n=1 Tax=Antribacter soli TaxID=2910976 RepID=A0AA41QF36_9MICO|nr:tetratricopeptide repeat protein [Antribacter soli]MCF4121976.1 tetratricopeptide repeat protein [Antribacter soli]
MRFQLLGHVSAESERGQVRLGSARQRTVLAALLVELGVPVSLELLIDKVWGATPPRSARQTLHSYLSRLRSVLDDEGGPALDHRSGGYVLDADESAVDLHRFRALVARARRADDADAAALWQDALSLWRGRPFADLDSEWLRSVAVTLEAERQAAVLDHNDVLLRRGEHARLLPSVAEAALESPLDERLAGQLMLALYRCDRQADALAHYRLVRERLADELGSDPGPALRELHQGILRHHQELAAPATASPTVGAPAGADGDAVDDPVTAERPYRPAQLPLDAAGFTGRSDDLRRLDDLLSDASADRARREVVVTAISGTAGVGKTALAVHWAHQVADRFPDGQLYVNLRGYDPDQPLRPTDALARFLTALGVAERDIPLDSDERAARYRSELAGRRMLIVLDNAGSVAQVRPLLPGSGTSLVVVTSRDSLAGLVAVHGAYQVDLDLLPPAEAVGLLHRLIGERVTAEPQAAATLADQCARLPLALRVAAVLATSRPDSPLADVVAELADRQARLELLDPGGDPYAAVHAVLSWSIQHLPEHAARTFRRLGLHPGPDLDPYAAAALTGTEPNTARRVLELLVNAHLLHRTGPGRYGMHDLLRAYATHLTATQDTDEDRETAEERLLDYYQAAAVSAMSAQHPAEPFYRSDAATAGVAIPDLSGSDTARGWLEAERLCVLAIAEHAADAGRSGYVVRLARTLHRYVSDIHLTDMLTINGHALRASERAGDQVGQAHALRQLGVGYTRVGQHETAAEHDRRALALFRQAGDPVGEALTLTNLGFINYQRGDHKDALDGFRQAIALSRQAGDPVGEAYALNSLGLVEARLGDHARSVEIHHQALAIYQELGFRDSQAVTLNNLANAELRRKRYPLAAEHLRQALEILEDLGSHRGRAHTLDTLGTLHLHLKEPGPATKCFQQALVQFRRIGDRNGQAWSTNGLGEAALLTGDAAAALTLHTDALAIATESGPRHQQARAHAGIGHARHAMGELDLARTHYERAYVIYTELDMPDAEDVRAQMEKASVA